MDNIMEIILAILGITASILGLIQSAKLKNLRDENYTLKREKEELIQISKEVIQESERIAKINDEMEDMIDKLWDMNERLNSDFKKEQRDAIELANEVNDYRLKCLRMDMKNGRLEDELEALKDGIDEEKVKELTSEIRMMDDYHKFQLFLEQGKDFGEQPLYVILSHEGRYLECGQIGVTITEDEMEEKIDRFYCQVIDEEPLEDLLLDCPL